VMIALMWALLRLFVSPRLEEAAREHAQHAQAGHVHHAAGDEAMSWRERITSGQAWSDVAHNFRGDWRMLYKEITVGFLLAGFIALLGDDFFNGLFLESSPSFVQTVWGAFIGPVIAVLSFVCSVGNVPLAAVLWSGGISFAGVMAFIFADLIVLPIVVAYRKYYGTPFALRITALMFVTMVIAALVIDLLFSGLGLIPSHRPTTDDVFGSIELDYKAALNALGLVLFATLLAMTLRRGVTDPVCGMRVDQTKALTAEFAGRTYHFCSESCRHAFQADRSPAEHHPVHRSRSHT
jgi:YHS domain-containing protein